MNEKNVTQQIPRFFLLNLFLKISFILALVNVSGLAAQAQDKGIHFEKGKTWNQVLAQAKKENKYIFVDCYTTWCGPCKYMSANIFPQEAVGAFFNKNFINVKLQIDSTAKDGEDVKKQYADAAFISSTYKIQAYPTYLFFNSDGDQVHRELGSSEATAFIDKATNALNPDKQYYTQQKKYDLGNRDQAFLRNLTNLAAQAYDQQNASSYLKDFLATKPDLTNATNLKLLFDATNTFTDTGFAIMINNQTQFEKLLGKTNFRSKLGMLILQSESSRNHDSFKKWGAKEWDVYADELSKKYPANAEDVLVQVRTGVSLQANNWKAFADAVDRYAGSPAHSIEMLNNYAWSVFERSKDKEILTAALRWSKLSFENETKKEPGFIDTYANLLYKLGQKEEAITWEKKAQAIAIEQGAEKDWGQDVIDKILKNEPTW